MSQHRFDTPGEVQVRVDNRSGAVRLGTHSGTTTEVELTSDDLDDEALEETRVEHKEVDGRHRVVVEVPSSMSSAGSRGVRVYGRHRVRVVVPGLGDLLRSSLGGNEVVVTVRAPEGAAIDVVTDSGDITAEGRFGATKVETRSGQLSLESVGGDLNVRSESGDVTVRSVAGEARITTASGDVHCGALGGDTQVKSASGDIAVGSARGVLSVQTSSGDLTAGELVGGCELQSASGDQCIERAVAGRARLQSVSGDLSIGIARSTVVAVDAETVTGDLSSEIDLDPDEPGAYESSQPDQRVDLRARTVSGDVHIRRAAT